MLDSVKAINAQNLVISYYTQGNFLFPKEIKMLPLFARVNVLSESSGSQHHLLLSLILDYITYTSSNSLMVNQCFRSHFFGLGLVSLNIISWISFFAVSDRGLIEHSKGTG